MCDRSRSDSHLPPRPLSFSFIIQLYEVFHSPSHVHLVLENGGLNLYDLIDDSPGLNTMASQNVILSLALALAHCQEQGVVHRDVKPENILVHVQQPESTMKAAECVVTSVKLCDFGLCAIAPVKATFESRAQQRGYTSTEDSSPTPTTMAHELDMISSPTSITMTSELDMIASPTSTTMARELDVISSPTSITMTRELDMIASPTSITMTRELAWSCDANSDDDAVVPERNWGLHDFSGSPGFIAPEIVTSYNLYDGRMVDIFSLGCVLLETVVGHKKFDDMWMPPFQPHVMADGGTFSTALQHALAQLRREDFFTTNASSDNDTDGSAEEGCSRCTTELGNLAFGLLEVDPTNRTPIRMVLIHRWLASAAI